MDVLRRTVAHAEAHLAQIGDEPVAELVDAERLRTVLGGPLPEHPEDPIATIDRLVEGARPGLVASPGPRYFGFVTGGSVPAALAADWLTSAWDQNSAFGVMSPAAAVVEEVAAGWLLEVLDLPASASVGFVTGAQMANTTCLAAARHELLGHAGWDVERLGLIGAPPLRVIAAAETHVTLLVALRYLGLGAPGVVIPADDQGRMVAEDLARELDRDDGAPTVVCAQAGNVNTGAADPLERIAARCRESGAWLHVDGAFGLWAAAAPARRDQVAGAAMADSWATDGHKWLNVPYDCGIAITAHPDAHRAAMTMTAAYLVAGDGIRDGADWAPEASRRARAFTVWAALRSLGRIGIAELVERCCALAERMARRLANDPGVEVLNDVVLNQVLVRFRPPSGGDADAFTDAVIRRVQDGGVCWAGGTVWHGLHAMRISVSNWSTTGDDIDISAEAILAARDAVAGERVPAD